MQAILLPPPPSRVNFSSSKKALQRYLAIEHYFSDTLLAKHGLKGDPVAVGTTVFEVDGDSSKKVRFAEAVKGLDSSEFSNFTYLFGRIGSLPL
jgi:hypothetical protein